MFSFWGALQFCTVELEEKELEVKLAKEKAGIASQSFTPQELVQEAGMLLKDIPSLMASDRVEERKTALRSFIHRIDIDKATEEARLYFYKVPINEKSAGQLLASGGFHGIHKKYCGGWI